MSCCDAVSEMKYVMGFYKSAYREVMCKMYVKQEIATFFQLFGMEFENQWAKLSPFPQNQGGCDGWRLDEALKFIAERNKSGNYLPKLNEWIACMSFGDRVYETYDWGEVKTKLFRVVLMW